MATRFDSWESYFYPETYDPLTGQGVLRNLREWRSAEALRTFEYRMAGARQRQLLAQPDLVEKTFDAAHVRAIHRHLFQDVYEWAGEYRGVNMVKGGGRGFGDVKTGEVDRYLGDVHELVVSTPWADLQRDDFGERCATVFAYLNQAHPFREGNGRTSKVFMEHVAERSRFALDFAVVPPLVWNLASEYSRPQPATYEPQPESMIPVFQEIAIERPAANPPDVDGASAARALLSASYPRPATQAPGSSAEYGTARPGRSAPGAGYSTGRGEGR